MEMVMMSTRILTDDQEWFELDIQKQVVDKKNKHEQVQIELMQQADANDDVLQS